VDLSAFTSDTSSPRMKAFVEDAKPSLIRLNDIMKKAADIYDSLSQIDKQKLAEKGITAEGVEEMFAHSGKGLLYCIGNESEKDSDVKKLDYYIKSFSKKRDAIVLVRQEMFGGTSLDKDEVTQPYVDVANELIALAHKHIREAEKQMQKNGGIGGK
jgi:hypothetical protein